MEPSFSQLEELVERIHRVLAPIGADVKRSATLKDPDTDQPRQIDVVIRESGKYVHVECRNHKHPQDVKWIEELIGRRISLKADLMIAVSISGFTGPAQKKASAFGIILRTLRDINDDEMKTWLKPVSVNVQYVEILDAKLVLYLPEQLPYPAPGSKLLLKGAPADLDPRLIFLQQLIHGENLAFHEDRATAVSATLSTPGLFIGPCPVLRAQIKFRGRLRVEHLSPLRKRGYGAPDKNIMADAAVYCYPPGKSEIIQGENASSLSLEFSNLVIPTGCFPYRWGVDQGRVVRTQVARAGQSRLSLEGIPFQNLLVSVASS